MTVVDARLFVDEGYVYVEWSDFAFTGTRDTYRLYRTDLDTTEEVLLYDGPATTFNDWTGKSLGNYEYEVRQYNTDPELADTPVVVNLETSKYWLVHPSDPSLSIRLDHVKSDSFTDEYEEFVSNVIGRGRHIDYGTNYGVTGTLSASFRSDESGLTATQKKNNLLALKGSGSWVWLRTPFGDMWKVGLGQVGFDRVAGVAMREDASVTIPYQQVA